MTDKNEFQDFIRSLTEQFVPPQKNIDTVVKDLKSILDNKEMMINLVTAVQQLQEVSLPHPLSDVCHNLVGSKAFDNILGITQALSNSMADAGVVLADNDDDRYDAVNDTLDEIKKKLLRLTEITNANSDRPTSDKWQLVDTVAVELMEYAFDRAEHYLKLFQD